jgi:hypothetical protein
MLTIYGNSLLFLFLKFINCSIKWEIFFFLNNLKETHSDMCLHYTTPGVSTLWLICMAEDLMKSQLIREKTHLLFMVQWERDIITITTPFLMFVHYFFLWKILKFSNYNALRK